MSALPQERVPPGGDDWYPPGDGLPRRLPSRRSSRESRRCDRPGPVACCESGRSSAPSAVASLNPSRTADRSYPCRRSRNFQRPGCAFKLGGIVSQHRRRVMLRIDTEGNQLHIRVPQRFLRLAHPAADHRARTRDRCCKRSPRSRFSRVAAGEPKGCTILIVS